MTESEAKERAERIVCLIPRSNEWSKQIQAYTLGLITGLIVDIAKECDWQREEILKLEEKINNIRFHEVV